jgi:hypothetical protein
VGDPDIDPRLSTHLPETSEPPTSASGDDGSLIGQAGGQAPSLEALRRRCQSIDPIEERDQQSILDEVAALSDADPEFAELAVGDDAVAIAHVKRKESIDGGHRRTSES